MQQVHISRKGFSFPRLILLEKVFPATAMPISIKVMTMIESQLIASAPTNKQVGLMTLERKNMMGKAWENIIKENNQLLVMSAQSFWKRILANISPNLVHQWVFMDQTVWFQAKSILLSHQRPGGGIVWK